MQRKTTQHPSITGINRPLLHGDDVRIRVSRRCLDFEVGLSDFSEEIPPKTRMQLEAWKTRYSACVRFGRRLPPA